MDSTAWAALGTWFTAAIYIAILVYATRQVGEAKKLRHAQTRPFVVVDLEPGFLLYLRFENIGATMARNVRFSFEPRLDAATKDLPDLNEVALLRDGLECLPPGKSYRLFFDTINERIQNGELPMRYRVAARYEDDEGQSYADRFTLDIAAIVDTPISDKGLPDLVKEVAELRKEVRKWTDGTRGLLVHARDKDEMNRLDRHRIEERRKQRMTDREDAGE